MILPDRYYQVIKRIVLTVLSAASVLVTTLGKAYGWNGTDVTVLTINTAATFSGVITGVSVYNLRKQEETDEKGNHYYCDGPINGSFFIANKRLYLHDQQ